jgi:hypothetical protein
MKRNTLLLVFSMLFFGTSVFYACQSGKQQATAQRYPNKSSELAVLMRQMWEQSDEMRQALLAGKSIADVRKDFAQLKTAASTDAGKTESEVYQAMAGMFMERLDKLYENPNADEQIQAYNSVVQSCLQCHQSQCPGPMVRIEKLFIKR